MEQFSSHSLSFPTVQRAIDYIAYQRHCWTCKIIFQFHQWARFHCQLIKILWRLGSICTFQLPIWKRAVKFHADVDSHTLDLVRLYYDFDSTLVHSEHRLQPRYLSSSSCNSSRLCNFLFRGFDFIHFTTLSPYLSNSYCLELRLAYKN